LENGVLMSATFGSNAVDYAVANTINTSLGANSPTYFKAGGHQFSNIIGNIDISRDFGALVLGAELKYVMKIIRRKQEKKHLI
jgi:hypothetical protein